MARKRYAPTKIKIDPDTQFSYKNAAVLKRLVSEQGYIASREITSLSMKQQRRMAREIKRARHLALLPFTQTL